MENARILDERLRKIIGEVSGRTGGEIKKTLVNDIEDCVQSALEAHTRKESIRFLTLLKASIDKFI